MSDVKTDVGFKFRVKAENHLGWWSEYRTSDELFNPQSQVETLRNEDAPWKIFLTGFFLVCLVLTMLIKYCMLFYFLFKMCAFNFYYINYFSRVGFSKW